MMGGDMAPIHPICPMCLIQPGYRAGLAASLGARIREPWKARWSEHKQGTRDANGGRRDSISSPEGRGIFPILNSTDR